MRINVSKLGKAVRTRRESEGQLQATIAELAGVAQGVISRIENGYGSIDGTLYARLCNYLGVSLDTFVEEDAETDSIAA